MRLTLRTLLAWRDRLLPEPDQRDLDQKVSSAEAAQKLEQRIREVLSRAELPAPHIDGKGLAASANSVAEFLDNALAADQLATFEANCVESDVQLCEVAECHHLLAGMTGQPQVAIHLDDAECQRLTEAISRRSEQLTGETDHAADVANARSIRAELDAIEQSEATTAAAVVPGSRQRSRVSTYAAVVAVAVLIGLAAILGLQLSRESDRQQIDRQQIAQRQPAEAIEPAVAEPAGGQAAEPAAAENGEPAAPAVGAAAAGDAAPPASPAAEPTEAVTPTPPAAELAESSPSMPASPAAQPSQATPAATPAAAPAGSMANRPQVPQGTAMAIAATSPSLPPAVGPAGMAPADSEASAAAVPSPTAPANPQPVLGFLENDAIVGSGIVLHRAGAVAELDGWQPLLADSQLDLREEVLVPPGLSPSFDVGGVRVRMRPLTHAILKLDSLGMPRVELLAGSLVIRSANEAAQLGLSAGGLTGVVLSGLPGGVAVEISRLPGTEQAARQTAQTQVARLLPLDQQVRWQQTQAGGLPPRRLLRGLDAETVFAPLELVEWRESDPLAVTRQAIDKPPVWASPLRRIPSLDRDASEALVAAVTGGDPLLKALIELSVDRRIENRMVAVETLALVGRFDELVELLRESPPSGPAAGLWQQLEARTVPPAFSDPTLALVLEKAFRDHISSDRAATLVGLARRSLPAASADDLTGQLIDLLEDDELILRRYAFAWLQERFAVEQADLIKYRADWPPEQRREGAAWWRKQLAKGLLVPRQATAGTPPNAG